MKAIIAALPREVVALVRGIEPDERLRRKRILVYRLPSAVVACAGMGAERAVLAVRAALDAGASGLLVSTGLAGACGPELKVGQVIEAGQVIDVRSGERFATVHEGAVLVTSPSIADVAEKRRLNATYGAALVDMEAAAVARQAQAHGLEFRVIKAVSDAHDFELDDVSQFVSPDGRFRTAAFALHTAVRPQRWPAAIRLGKGSQVALSALTEVLRGL